MKPTLDFDEKVLDNASEFKGEFYERFKLRHAPAPIRLTDNISKNYFFPTFYGDVTCAMGIFLCSYARAEKMMLHPRIKPVRMTRGRSLVAFSCYEYQKVLGVAPYNEIAMTIPVMVDAPVNIPVLPMVLPIFKSFGYYVFSMPVTSQENMLRGHAIWGLPKAVQEIDIGEDGGDCVTSAKEPSGETYFELRVPTAGTRTSFDVSSNLYTRLGDRFCASETCFKADFNVNKFMSQLFTKNAKPDRQYLKIGNGPSGKVLQDLEIEEHPFQLRFARQMTACFDLPNPEFKSSISFGP